MTSTITTDEITTASAAGRYSPLCPDWCTHSAFDHEQATSVINGGQPVVDHQGPSFGPFFVDATEYLLEGDRPLEIRAHGELPDDSEGLGAGDLRQLAVDAVAAAEWLAQRDHEAGTCHLSEWSCSWHEAGQ